MIFAVIVVLIKNRFFGTFVSILAFFIFKGHIIIFQLSGKQWDKFLTTERLCWSFVSSRTVSTFYQEIRRTFIRCWGSSFALRWWMAGLVLFFFSMRFKKPSSNLKRVNKANIPVHERLTTGIVITRVKMTLYSGSDHNKLALRRQQGLTAESTWNLWISVIYNMGEGGLTNNIITYVNNPALK